MLYRDCAPYPFSAPKVRWVELITESWIRDGNRIPLPYFHFWNMKDVHTCLPRHPQFYGVAVPVLVLSVWGGLGKVR